MCRGVIIPKTWDLLLGWSREKRFSADGYAIVRLSIDYWFWLLQSKFWHSLKIEVYCTITFGNSKQWQEEIHIISRVFPNLSAYRSMCFLRFPLVLLEPLELWGPGQWRLLSFINVCCWLCNNTILLLFSVLYTMLFTLILSLSCAHFYLLKPFDLVRVKKKSWNFTSEPQWEPCWQCTALSRGLMSNTG